MAINTEAIPKLTATYYPPGYSVPTQNFTMDAPNEEKFTVDIARGSVENADEAVGLAALVTAIKNHVDTDLIPNTLHLDAAASVEGVIFIDKIEDINTAKMDPSKICKTAVNVIRCTCRFQWETAPA